MDLQAISTDDLAQELLNRKGSLLDPKGVIISVPLFKLLPILTPIICADAVPVKWGPSREIMAGAMIRNTGQVNQQGLFSSIGGRNFRRPEGRPAESVEDCLRRQVRTDIGCEMRMSVTDWRHPASINQTAPEGNNLYPLNGFAQEDAKQSVSLCYPVEIIGTPTFGSTPHGGQEASGFKWFSWADMPPDKGFAYGMFTIYVDCMKMAERQLPR